MRYFKLNKAVSCANNKGNVMILGYKELFEALIEAPLQLSAEKYLRMAALYSKFLEAKEEDTLEIEDQDYEVLKQKLEAYVSHISQNATGLMGYKVFVEFLTDIKEMSKEKLKQDCA